MSRDHTRRPNVKARTISRRTARRMRIAQNVAVLLGLDACQLSQTQEA